MQKSFPQKPYIHLSNQEEVQSNNTVPVPCMMSFQSMRSWNEINLQEVISLEKQIQITAYYIILLSKRLVHSKKE